MNDIAHAAELVIQFERLLKIGEHLVFLVRQRHFNDVALIRRVNAEFTGAAFECFGERQIPIGRV